MCQIVIVEQELLILAKFMNIYLIHVEIKLRIVHTTETFLLYKKFILKHLKTTTTTKKGKPV